MAVFNGRSEEKAKRKEDKTMSAGKFKIKEKLEMSSYKMSKKHKFSELQ